MEKEYNECQSDISRLRTDISLDEAAIKGCKKHIAVYTKNIDTFPDVCEECGRPYSKKIRKRLLRHSGLVLTGSTGILKLTPLQGSNMKNSFWPR